MSKIAKNFRLQRRQLLLVAICAIAVYVIVPQIGDFNASWHIIRHPDGRWVLAALGFTMLTFSTAAGTYCFLATKRLLFGRTLVVQLAAMLINRLLPAGVGALGINYAYLRHEGHSSVSAASVVTLNNALGFVGHMVLLVVVVLFSSTQAVATVTRPTSASLEVVKIGIVILLLGLVAGLYWGWSRLWRFMARLIAQLILYRHRPKAVLGALTTSVLLTLCNVLCLACCLTALHIQLPFVAMVLIFSFGVGVGVVTPTPGGLGGFEAGLAAGLVLYRVDSSLALAAALLYRFISYWFPLVLGSIALAVSQRHNWLETGR